MGNALLDMLTVQGQIAFVLASVVLTAVGLVMMLWRPRHATYEQHDCRSMGCQWLEDKPGS
jgi:cell division protein FtsL